MIKPPGGTQRDRYIVIKLQQNIEFSFSMTLLPINGNEVFDQWYLQIERKFYLFIIVYSLFKTCSVIHFQIQTIDGRLTLVNSDSSRFGQISNEQKLSSVKTKHHELGPIADTQEQQTFFKSILTERLPDSQVKFEPNAVSRNMMQQ